MQGYIIRLFNIMNQDKKKYLRSLLFRHLDGIALCSPISALNKHGITEYIKIHPIFSSQDLFSQFQSNTGYLNITLRLLASQGWLKQDILEDGANIHYKLTEKGEKFIKISQHYDPFSEFIPTLINIEQYLFNQNSKYIFLPDQECLGTHLGAIL